MNKTQNQAQGNQVNRQYKQESRLEDKKIIDYLDPSIARALKTHLQIETVGELLEFYPRKYLPRGELTPFADLLQGQEATLIARVLRVRTRKMRARRGSITEITITDRLNEREEQGESPSAHPRVTGSAAGHTDSYGRSLPMEQAILSDRLNASFRGYSAEKQGRADDSSTMVLSFFNAWTAAREIREGDQVMFSGKVGSYRGELTLTNPHYAVLAENRGRDEKQTQEAIARAKVRASSPIPVYRASAKLPTDRIAAAVEDLLKRAPLKELGDPLPEAIRRRHKIPSLAQTYRAVHTPDTEETWRVAHHFLRYREAFVLQAALARNRAARAGQPTVARPPVPNGLAERLPVLLPYQLTEGQQKVGEQIARDLSLSSPMNRLLQGDVGSGKTVVALRAMLQVVDNGAQAALLAPTEVLAEQHYRSVMDILGELAVETGGAESLAEHENTLFDTQPIQENRVRTVLLKAAMPARAKKQALIDIAAGRADIVIGTHALLADTVNFADLGMVVVDEQHRFGVEQRDALRGKDDLLPHRLVMTATPIPRTVAMTVFGDLDISVLDQLPEGRQKVQTVVVPLAEHPRWVQRLWERAREEIDAGHQVYVVVPKIGEEDSPDSPEEAETLGSLEISSDTETGHRQLNSVVSMIEELTQLPILAGLRIAALHGRMGTDQKTETMRRFEHGDIDLLVSTTVIEVGVNVPNATLMIIMDADRFGISGLHQLRGRIGRGNLPGTCLLVTTQEAGGVSRQRLDAVAATTNGFELSRIDLEQRREGDILGAAQSGKKSRLKLLRALDDAALIEKARKDAQELVEENPTLDAYPDLVRTIDRSLDSEREAFLGRG